jgi:hypothetical protein
MDIQGFESDYDGVEELATYILHVAIIRELVRDTMSGRGFE